MQSLDPAVFTVAEVAQLLGLSRSNTYARVRDGSIPSVKLGGRILVPKRLLERLLESTDRHGEGSSRR